jgi:hypothetical protein
LGHELVARVAGLLWRLRRALIFEGSIIEARCAEITPEEVETSDEWFESARKTIAARFRAAAAGKDVRSLPPEVTKVELKKEPTDRSQLAQRKIGLALTRDGKLLHLLGALARHEGALLNGLTPSVAAAIFASKGANKHEGR